MHPTENALFIEQTEKMLFIHATEKKLLTDTIELKPWMHATAMSDCMAKKQK
jgi:hypothetical protein